MKKQLILIISLILISTATYFFSNVQIDASLIRITEQNKEMYQFFCYKLAGAYLLTAVYCWISFLLTNVGKIVQKLGLGYLAIMESVTFIFHIIDKLYKQQVTNYHQIIITLIIFAILSSYVIFRAVYTPKSDKFDLKNTYIVKFKPKNTLGIINQIIHGTGHKAIYQDGKIYQFKKKSRKIEEFPVKLSFFDQKDIIVKKTNRIDNISKLLNKNYNTITYNCNTFVKEALNES